MARSKAKKGKKQSYYSKSGLAKAGRLAKNAAIISGVPAPSALAGGQNIIREYKGKKPANSWGKTLMGIGGGAMALSGAGLGSALFLRRRGVHLPKSSYSSILLAGGMGTATAHEGYKRYKNYKQTGKRIKGFK